MFLDLMGKRFFGKCLCRGVYYFVSAVHLSLFCNSFSCLVRARIIVPEWDIYGWDRKHVSVFRSVDVGGLHKSVSYNWKLLFHRKMLLRSHSVTWDDFYTTFVTRNWAESFPKTLFSLRMLSFSYVLYSDILINVEKCPMQCEASSNWHPVSTPLAQLCARRSPEGGTGLILQKDRNIFHIHI
jgi:hypothetical protein